MRLRYLGPEFRKQFERNKDGSREGPSLVVITPYAGKKPKG